MNIKGIIPAIPTPFDQGGNLNLASLHQMLSFLYKAGVHGIFVAGNAGEFYALDDKEKQTLLSETLKIVGGKIPVFFGAGSPTTKESVLLAQMAQTEGADAVSVITPYLIKPSEDELFNHYEKICAATRLPVFLYNNPAVTGVSASPRVAKRLAKIDNFVGVKDSSGDFATTIEFLRIKKEGFSVFAGRDNLILATLEHGGAGAMSSVASACPEVALGIYNAYIKGDYTEALHEQMRFAKLRQLFSLGTFPTVIKAVLRIRGIDVGCPRAPVSELAESRYHELEEDLQEALIGKI